MLNEIKLGPPIRFVRKFAWFPTPLIEGYVAWIEFYLQKQTLVNGTWTTTENRRWPRR